MQLQKDIDTEQIELQCETSAVNNQSVLVQEHSKVICGGFFHVDFLYHFAF